MTTPMPKWQQHSEETSWRFHHDLEAAFAGLALRPEDAAAPTQRVVFRPPTAEEMDEERRRLKLADTRRWLRDEARNTMRRDVVEVVAWIRQTPTAGDGKFTTTTQRAQALKDAAGTAYGAWAADVVAAAILGDGKPAPQREWLEFVAAMDEAHGSRAAALPHIEAGGWALYAAWRRWEVADMVRRYHATHDSMRVRHHLTSGILPAEAEAVLRFAKTASLASGMQHVTPVVVSTGDAPRGGWFGLYPLHLDPPPASWLDKTSLD
jgi:hypothetical protein